MESGRGLFRLLGDEARLRLLRCCARERLNVTELTGDPRPRAVGRVAAPRAAEGRRPGRRGARRRLHLLPARAGAARRRTAIGAAVAAARARSSTARRTTPAVRADEARLQEVLRLRKENFDAHAGPDTQTRASSCRAAAGRRGRARSASCCRRSTVADLGCGEGYLTIEAAAGRRASSPSIDRTAVLDARARAGRAAPRRRTSIWKRGELEKLPIEDAQRRRRAAVAGAAPRRTIRRARVAEAARIIRARRPRASSTCAQHERSSGSRERSAIAGSASTTTS